MDYEFVTLKKHEQETGYTPVAIRSKIARGDLIEGVHYVKAPDGNININVKEWNKWVLSSNTKTA